MSPNEILRYILEIDKYRYNVSSVKLPVSILDRLRKNSKKKSSYASNKIEGNPLSFDEVDEVVERDERKHFLKPEQEVRNYYLALEFLDEMVKRKEPFSKKLILDVQKLVEKGASKENIGLRGLCLQVFCLRYMIQRLALQIISLLNIVIFLFCWMNLLIT